MPGSGSRPEIPADEETDYPRHRRPSDQHECLNERRIRQLERKMEGHDIRLGDGSQVMTELTLTVKQLAEAVKELREDMAKVKQPNPIVQKVIDAAVQALVPIAILAGVWLVVQSGAVPVKPPAVPAVQEGK